jgi:hypothetical protein
MAVEGSGNMGKQQIPPPIRLRSGCGMTNKTGQCNGKIKGNAKREQLAPIAEE